MNAHMLTQNSKADLAQEFLSFPLQSSVSRKCMRVFKDNKHHALCLDVCCSQKATVSH